MCARRLDCCAGRCVYGGVCLSGVCNGAGMWIDALMLTIVLVISWTSLITIGTVVLIIKDISRLVAGIRSIQFGGQSGQTEIPNDRTLPRAGLRRLIRVLYR